MTLALVLFGLVPPSIIAAVALDAAEDFKKKQMMLIRLAATTISDRLEGLLAPRRGRPGQGGQTRLGRRHRQGADSNNILDMADAPATDSTGPGLRRRSRGRRPGRARSPTATLDIHRDRARTLRTPHPGDDARPRVPWRGPQQRPGAVQVLDAGRPDRRSPKSSAIAPLRLRGGITPYGVLVIVPRDDAYETIDTIWTEDAASSSPPASC